MKAVTFQVVEGVDKGRIFRDLPIPVTLGREEGNTLRLNDERVSRYHAKIQIDHGDVILTDLESTNGTRVNGYAVRLRRLRPGDRVGVGRSELIYGSFAQIGAFAGTHAPQHLVTQPSPCGTVIGPDDLDDFDLNILPEGDPFWESAEHDQPALPLRLTPSQAARLAEILDFLHRGIGAAVENARVNEELEHVTMRQIDWQKIQAVQMLLGRYARAVAEPDALVD